MDNFFAFLIIKKIVNFLKLFVFFPLNFKKFTEFIKILKNIKANYFKKEKKK